MTWSVVVTMLSVMIGFAAIGASFWVVMSGRSRRLAVLLGITAFLFVTVIPVGLALWVSSPMAGSPA